MSNSMDSPDQWDLYRTREFVASRYLRGEGIEIGALHQPLAIPMFAKVKYLDKWSADVLRKQYPEFESDIVDVDILDDGERLDNVEDSSQNFVIANHFLEHSQNPIDTLSNILRVLKDGGTLFLAIPDKRYTFDEGRPITPIEHILRDYKEGPAWSKRQHFEEWVRIVNKVHDEDEAQSKISRLVEADTHIHYHVWTQAEMLEMLLALKNDLNFGFEFELFIKNYLEVIFILKKVANKQ